MKLKTKVTTIMATGAILLTASVLPTMANTGNQATARTNQTGDRLYQRNGNGQDLSAKIELIAEISDLTVAEVEEAIVGTTIHDYLEAEGLTEAYQAEMQTINEDCDLSGFASANQGETKGQRQLANDADCDLTNQSYQHGKN